jgi:nucleoid-associated protein YgaU
MSRVLLMVGLVAAMLVTGVATASPDNQVRIPITVTPDQPSEPEAHSVIVVKGDHLWKISARRLGPEASNGVIAPYWREVIETNAPRLQSGDPDLIYPGEVVELPPVTEQG